MAKPIQDYFVNARPNAFPDFVVTLDTLTRVTKTFSQKIENARWDLLEGISDLSDKVREESRGSVKDDIQLHFNKVNKFIHELNYQANNHLVVNESDWKVRAEEFSKDFSKLKGSINQTSLENHDIVKFLNRFESTLTNLGLLETSNGINR
jgi:hypothetical protein